MSINFTWLLLLACSSWPLLASSKPTIESWQNETYTIENMEVSEFFEKRREQEECRKKHAEKRASLQAAKKALDAAIVQYHDEKTLKKHELKSIELKYRKAQDAFYEISDLAWSPGQTEISACGDCTVPKVEIVKFNEGLTQKYWYESHGFCSFDSLTEGEVGSAFGKISKMLRTPKAYVGLFESVLEFVPFANRVYLDDFGTAEKQSTFNAYMAVRATKLLGRTFAYGYFIKNRVKASDDVFELEFEGTSNQGMRPRELSDVSVLGEKSKVKTTLLKEIIGWWHIDPQTRILRYSTAADFGQDLKALKPFARRIHLDTVSTAMQSFLLSEESETK